MTKAVASHWNPKLFTTVVGALFLLGCATDYKAVKEGDLNEIRAQLQATERALDELGQEQIASRDLLFIAEQESMRRMLGALKEQIKAPECPVVEVSKASGAGEISNQTPTTSSTNYTRDGKLVIGEVEGVYLDPPAAVYQARIDTGATTSSLDAREIQTFERDGEDWVRFKMPMPGGTQLADIERKVSHFVRILQSSADGSDRRPVVKMRIMIGNIERLAEFTLSDREHLEYPVLIGRNVLKDTMMVDVSRANSVSLPEGLPSSEAIE